MSAKPSAYEEIETQLDACAHRIQELEHRLRAEIEQQQADVRKLRSQLRRAIKATAGAQRPAPAPTTAAPTAAYEHHSFIDPFESALLDPPEESGPAAQTQAAPEAQRAEPVVEQPEPVVEQAEPVVEEQAEPVAEQFELAAEPEGTIEAADEFVPDAFDDLLPLLPADDEPAAEPTALSGAKSAFNMLLDWSDFEQDESVEDVPASHSGNGAHAGDGTAASRVLLPPTLRADRPVPITRRVAPKSGDAAAESRSEERDLTAIPGIDDAMQASLHRLGITTLDEIAGWHLGDACRIAEQLGTVSEREIIDRWVPEAQAALFDLFQQRLRRTRLYDSDER